ncbi:acyl--CoA ligase [Aspergillus lucknowensis]|uniref:Phenylacetyl-CoA ligase n=1 Tax=Aspergillus lucknowensis TaxID=176173 RepID=A0ABR4LZQ8_9EURO
MPGPSVPEVGIWKLLFQRQRRSFPDDHVIFQDGASKRSYTYEDLRTTSEQFGRALRSHWHWKRGDVLVLMSPNCIDTPLVTWGCHYAGGVVAPVNPALSPRELQQQLVRSQAKGVVVHPNCLATALEAAKLAHLSDDRLLVLGESHDGNSSLKTVNKFIEDGTPATGSTAGPTDVSPDDVAFLVYSSGTTGLPKGVMVSHRNVVADVVLQAAIEGPHVGWKIDRALAVLPTYHIYGLICLVHLPVWIGTSTIIMEKFDLQTFCRLIQEHSITHVYVAPPVVLHLAKNRSINRLDLVSLRMITSGGAPLGAALIQETYNRWKIPVRQAYGLSETTSVSHIQRWDTWNQGIGSNGPAVPGVEAKIAISETQTAAAREEGELWIRGPTVFNGYMDDAAATEACLTADRWFKTGDIGFEDEMGNLYITDRAKDMIKFKGYQIAPTELEDILLDHPAVSDAAVIGVWNEEMQTEVPLAYIVRKGEAENRGDGVALSIMEHLKSKVVHYKRLRGGIIWISQIPKSPSGKILKRALRDRIGTLDNGKQIVDPEYARYRSAKL